MKYINKNHEAITMSVTSVVSIILAILSNFLYEFLKQYFSAGSNVLVFVFVILNIFVIFKVSQLIVYIKHKVFTNWYDEVYVQQAFIAMKSLANEQGEQLQTLLEENEISTQLLIDICVNNIKNVIRECFEFFDNTFSSKKDLIKAINFEITFMTKSYIDQEITIPAARNREHTQPLSMIRRKDNSKIYENTVTAEVYREYNKGEKPQMHIIQDTNKKGGSCRQSEYRFIYPGQGERIKSSIVLPIISHRNELLGTLVVHCDVKNFFKTKKAKFWKEVLEIFAVEIGKEKLYMDILLYNSELGLKPPF